MTTRTLLASIQRQRKALDTAKQRLRKSEDDLRSHLREQLKKRGLTLASMAKLIDEPTHILTNYFSGHQLIKPHHLSMILLQLEKQP